MVLGFDFDRYDVVGLVGVALLFYGMTQYWAVYTGKIANEYLYLADVSGYFYVIATLLGVASLFPIYRSYTNVVQSGLRLFAGILLVVHYNGYFNNLAAELRLHSEPGYIYGLFVCALFIGLPIVRFVIDTDSGGQDQKQTETPTQS